MVARGVLDEKTDAEQITDIVNEVQEEPNEETVEVALLESLGTNAKAKRTSRAKPKEVLTLPGVDQREPKEKPKEEPKEEPTEEPKEEPQEEPNSEDKVACPDW